MYLILNFKIYKAKVDKTIKKVKSTIIAGKF